MLGLDKSKIEARGGRQVNRRSHEMKGKRTYPGSAAGIDGHDDELNGRDEQSNEGEQQAARRAHHPRRGCGVVVVVCLWCRFV